MAVNPATIAGVYDVGPARPITGPELADAVGRGLDLAVTYEAITPEEFARRAEPVFGIDGARGIGGLYAALASDPKLALPDDSRRLATNQMMTVGHWAEQALVKATG